MKKNVASQVVSAQLNATADGSAVTGGTTTVYVTGDGGTQASGGGTVTHEGQGCWSYVPTQAETNYDHVSFTFVNSSAISQTVQTWPTFPQTGDSFSRIGSAGAGLTGVPWNASWDAEVESEVTDALNAYDPPTKTEMDSGFAGQNDLDAAAVRTALGMASANMDTQLSAIDTVVDSILADTGTDGVVIAGTPDVNVTQISGSATAADNLEASALGIETGQAATGTLSTTQMTTNLTEATDDHYNGRVVVFTSGVLANQATDITDYNGTTKLVTMTALTEAPSNGDTFVIV